MTKLMCHSEADALMEANVISGMELIANVDQTWTRFLVWPRKSVDPIHKSFIRNEFGKNSMEALLVEQTLDTEIRFYFMLGTHTTSDNITF